MLVWLETLGVEKVANAFIILLTGILMAFGFRGGRTNASTPAKPAVEVAADFFDAEAIGSLTREITGQAVAITGQSASVAGQTLATDRQTLAVEKQVEEAEELRHSINRVREAIDRLVLEMARRR